MLGLILITLVCYWPVRNAEFVNYDDPKYITQNYDAQKGLSSEALKYAFTSTDGGYRHPITWLSHLIDVELFGPKNNGTPIFGKMLGVNTAMPAGHHLTNLLFHLADTLLLFYVLRRLTGAVWPSAFVAAMFAVHPMHVESVAWISERKDVLSALFLFLTILAYKRFVEKPSAARYAVIVVSFAAALMSKPMMITIPGVLLILNLWPLNRITLGSGFWQSLKRPLLETMPLLALSAISGLISVIDTRSINSFYTLKDLPLSMRLETSVIAYARYLVKFFWPSNMIVFYPTPDAWPKLWVVGSCVLLVIITAAVVWRARRDAVLLFGWLWFLGTLLPAIGLVVTGDASMADRYTYVSYTGLFVALAWLAYDRLERFRPVLAGLGGAIVLVCCVLSFVQATRWKDSRTLMGYAVKVDPTNWTANLNYACALMGSKDEPSAGPYFRQAVLSRPGSVITNANYAQFLINRNKIDEASVYLMNAYNINKSDGFALSQIARVQAIKGQHASAVKILKSVLEKRPRDVEAELLLVSSLNALLLHDEAEAHLRHILSFDPTQPRAYHQLGLLAAKQNKPGEALNAFKRAVQLSPEFGKAHLDFGIALANAGQYGLAMEQLDLAMQTLDDQQLKEKSTVEFMIGRLIEKTAPPLDTAKQLEAADHYLKAIDWAKKAVSDLPDDPAVNFELANLLKQVGKTDEALVAAKKAMDVASSQRHLYFMSRLAEQFPSLVPATMPTTGPSTTPTTAPVQ